MGAGRWAPRTTWRLAPHPARYAEEGYRAAGPDEIRAQKDAARDKAQLDSLIEDLIYRRRQDVEIIHLAGDGRTPTPYEVGLAARGVSWADLDLPEPTPIDPARGGIPGMSWEFSEVPDREAET